MEANFKDYLGCAKDKDILKIIGNEIIYYSKSVFKYNKFSFLQERALLLTNKCLYNLKVKKTKTVQREMKYEEMRGITFSTISDEFVIHADKGYDFHFISPDKKTIIYIIAKCYEKLLNKPITICEVKVKSLKHYVTKKKEKKKDFSNSRIDENFIIDTQTFIIDNEPRAIPKRSLTMTPGDLIGNKPREFEKSINCKIILSNNSKIKEIFFSDIEFINLIARGVLGKVYLAKNKINKDFYAVKTIDKKIFEINNSMIEKIKNLKKNFPFLINIDCCFETDDRIYFSLQYIQGEDLFYNIKINKNFDEEKIRFYAGIIALTLDYLHSNGIEYRALNTRNILIEKNGYLKIIPFHLGKILTIKNNKYKNFLMKYKNEYSPPEVFLKDDSKIIETKSADWWSLGIILFEMTYGVPPFYTDDDSELKNIIINKELKYPNNPKISDNLKDLINKLLCKKYNERLGYSNGFEEIKKHEFFKDFNFDDLKEKKIKAPYKPILGNIEKGNKKFDDIYTYEDLRKFKHFKIKLI